MREAKKRNVQDLESEFRENGLRLWKNSGYCDDKDDDVDDDEDDDNNIYIINDKSSCDSW